MTALTKTGADNLGESLRNCEAFLPPVSEADQKFVESLERNVAKIKVRRKSLPGSLNRYEEEVQTRKKIPVNNELREAVKKNQKRFCLLWGKGCMWF